MNMSGAVVQKPGHYRQDHGGMRSSDEPNNHLLQVRHNNRWWARYAILYYQQLRLLRRLRTGGEMKPLDTDIRVRLTSEEKEQLQADTEKAGFRSVAELIRFLIHEHHRRLMFNYEDHIWAYKGRAWDDLSPAFFIAYIPLSAIIVVGQSCCIFVSNSIKLNKHNEPFLQHMMQHQEQKSPIKSMLSRHCPRSSAGRAAHS